MKITQSPSTQFFGGIPFNVPNEIRQNSDQFYISYNASSRDYGCPTTALVIGNCEKFYILKGDHRQQYEEAETLEACLNYFISHPELQHEYSDKMKELS